MRSSASTEPLTLRAPLMAFHRIYRHTGTIYRSCFLENHTDQPLQIDVKFDFKEHSWIQVLPVSGSEEDSEEPWLLSPGETMVRVTMDTNNSNFPFEAFRGRVSFEAASESGARSALEVSFEEVQELGDFEGFSAMDLGTSHSMLSLYHIRRDAGSQVPWSPSLEVDSREMPSAVFVRDLVRFRKFVDHGCLVGTRALNEYQDRPELDPRCLLLGTKRWIGRGASLVADSKGAGGTVDAIHPLYMLGRSVRERAQNHRDVKARIRDLIVTFPPSWDTRQISGWKEVFRRMGFDEDKLDLSLDEASAAGLFYIHKWTHESDSRKKLLQDLIGSRQSVQVGDRQGETYDLSLLSFDFGGGTIDLASILVKLTDVDDSLKLKIVLRGSDSMNYGGDQVTLAIFRLLKRRIALWLSDPHPCAQDTSSSSGRPPSQSFRRRPTSEGDMFALPAQRPLMGMLGNREERCREVIQRRREELESVLTDPELHQELEDAVDGLFPTRFWTSEEEPLSIEAKKHFGWLWTRAEALKRDLFRYDPKQVSISDWRGCSGEAHRYRVLIDDLPPAIAARANADPKQAEIWIRIDEVYRMISPSLEKALGRAKRLVGKDSIDRVVLTGQSSRIPMVRSLFMRPSSEGGFGLPHNKIEFDDENAKAAVSKGACLYRIMRESLVGYEVDVSEFRASLLSDVFYHNSLLGDRVLFEAGPIDPLTYVEETPDKSSFAEHLAIFSGSRHRVLGHFDFGEMGEPWPDDSAHTEALVSTVEALQEAPSHAELDHLKSRQRDVYDQVIQSLGRWPERVLIAWMERTTQSGTEDLPRYRYYLTANRFLYAVKDDGEKRLYALRVDRADDGPKPDSDDPFSGAH